jgi:hypothetical protein
LSPELLLSIKETYNPILLRLNPTGFLSKLY